MYKVYNGKTWIDFESYDELLNWLSQFNTIKLGKHVNTFLEKVGNSNKDTYRNERRIKTGKYFTIGDRIYPWYEVVVSYDIRENRVTTEDKISIYSSQLVKDALNYKHDPVRLREWRLGIKRSKQTWYGNDDVLTQDCIYPGFRREPQSGIHKSVSKWGYRHIRTTNERRQTCRKECVQFNRGRRAFNLPTVWDDIMYDWRDLSWKSQSKNRHQWENKVKQRTKHTIGKNVYVKKYDKHKYDKEDIEYIED